MDLEEDLKEYKALTLDIMEEINFYGNISHLLESREHILNKIKSSTFNIDELKKYCDAFRIVELDNEMNKLVKLEMENIKNKMRILKKKQQGNQQYMYSIQTRFNNSSFDRKY